MYWRTKGNNYVGNFYVIQLLQRDATDLYTSVSVEFIMSLDMPNVSATDGSTVATASLESGPVLRVIGSNSTQVSMPS